jgi:hypothetical protein
MSAGKLALIGSVVVVAGAVIAGLIVSGSPLEQRLIRYDDRRVADLQTISNALLSYYRETKSIPPNLETLVNGWIRADLPHDPQTEDRYEYVRLSDRSFQLCADFIRASDSDARAEFWAHDSGRQCFTLDYSGVRSD